MYLTYAEYTLISPEATDEETFNKMLRFATVKIDVLTNYFYNTVNFENDVPKRVEAFKTALTYMIDFNVYNGSAYSFEANRPLSITIGRTQQSVGDTNQKSINVDVPKETLDILSVWGFLYRGVGTTQC